MGVPDLPDSVPFGKPWSVPDGDEAVAIEAAADRLNALEMEARDLPPHFGAWCRSQHGGRLA